MGLADTLSRISSLRTISSSLPGTPGIDRLTDFQIDDNPGALRARCYVPATLPPGAPLVVALHGCTQTASGYDHGTGWSHLADANGFAVLLPEQQRGNNPNLCFNWFTPADTARDAGEAASIHAMIEAMITMHSLDRARVFVTGLSAGGAMANAMLAAYPDVFASGAIIAGLPFGAASSMTEAFGAMRGQTRPTKPLCVIAGGRLPTLSVWHGTADRTVAASNGDAVVDQWLTIHNLAEQPTRVDTVGNQPRSVWCDKDGREIIEYFPIAGMAHGLPLNPGDVDSREIAGPFMLDAGISSTRHIAHFWGIAPAVGTAQKPLVDPIHAAPGVERKSRPTGWKMPNPTFAPGSSKGGVSEVIENALRAAGLMK